MATLIKGSNGSQSVDGFSFLQRILRLMGYVIHQVISRVSVCIYDAIHVAANGIIYVIHQVIYRVSVCIYDVIQIAANGICHPSSDL